MNQNQISLSGKLPLGNSLAYLRLMRPANIITAVADVWAGYAIVTSLISQSFSFIPPAGLIFATIGLYGGGVVFNDVFDYSLDKKERPERPIPSGKVSLLNAGLLGSFLLAIGVSAAFTINVQSGLMAAVIAILALLYNAYSKHHGFLGPFNMGLCRSCNLMLGMLFIPDLLPNLAYLGLIPLMYIFAITLISRGEVNGSTTFSILPALIIYINIAFSLIWIGVFYSQFSLSFSFFFFLLLWMSFTFPPLIKALRFPEAMNIRMAVKMGVISLIILNSCLVSAFTGWENALFVLCFLPVSFMLSKIFAVT